MADQILSAVASRATKTADRSDYRAPDGLQADQEASRQHDRPDSPDRADSTDGQKAVGCRSRRTDVPDGSRSPMLSRTEMRAQLMRDLVLRALI